MKNVKDSYEERFYSYDDMVGAIKANTEEDEWFKVKNQDLRILPSTLEEFHDVSDEAVTDTMQNLGLSIYVKDRCFPMRDTVEKSLKERAGISGAALRRLSKKDLSTVLTLCLKTSPDLALAYISGEKVSALHSAKKKDYSVLPILDCIELLNKKLHGIFDGPEGNVCFKESYLSNWITQAKWVLPEKSKLLDDYRQSLINMGLSHANLVPMVSFQTSNIGISSVKCFGLIQAGSQELNLGDVVNVEHRGEKGMQSVEEMYDLLYAQMKDGIDRLTNLMTIEIHYPEQCMNRIAKEFKFPTTEGREIIDQFICAISGRITAYDVYCSFAEIPTLMRINGCSAKSIFSMQENISRVLKGKWSNFDKAGTVKF